MKFFYTALILTFVAPFAVIAQEVDTSGGALVSSEVCERIINGESKASARVRASDKASFKAVEDIPELRELRNFVDAHYFNLKVYRLVDNYLDDIKINVIRQNDEEVCVEVNAYLPYSAINEMFNDANDKAQVSSDEDMITLDIEDEALDDKVDITIPPKPEITINENIAFENTLEEDVVVDNAVPTKKENRPVVYVARTEFYNDTSTNGFFPDIKQQLSENKHITVIDTLNNPNYIIKTKVLKAKIDNVNSETGRLQIVVAVELTDVATSKITTEHQNRFVLFNTNDDTQITAANLTKKLISEGIAKILPLIKDADSRNTSGSIITPN